MRIFTCKNGMAPQRHSTLSSSMIRHRVVDPTMAARLTVAKDRLFNDKPEVRRAD